MKIFERAVRFDEVDAAGIVYFARVVGYCHEAMEAFFDGLDGGYAALIVERRIGLPAVKLEAEFHAPLRYGDRIRIETRVTRLGTKSADLLYRVHERGTEPPCAVLRHTVVTTDLASLRSCDMPSDVRALLEAHLDRG